MTIRLRPLQYIISYHSAILSALNVDKAIYKIPMHRNSISSSVHHIVLFLLIVLVFPFVFSKCGRTLPCKRHREDSALTTLMTNDRHCFCSLQVFGGVIGVIIFSDDTKLPIEFPTRGTLRLAGLYSLV